MRHYTPSRVVIVNSNAVHEIFRNYFCLDQRFYQYFLYPRRYGIDGAFRIEPFHAGAFFVHLRPISVTFAKEISKNDSFLVLIFKSSVKTSIWIYKRHRLTCSLGVPDRQWISCNLHFPLSSQRHLHKPQRGLTHVRWIQNTALCPGKF